MIVPISFTSNGNTIGAVAFSIDYDEDWSSFDNTDSDENGQFDLMASMQS